MTLTDRLDTLRQQVPGCTLVCFGDVETGLALRTSASRPHKQDYLDDLLLQARRGFALSDAVSPGHPWAVSATPKELCVFVRSDAGNSDVICCVCDAPAGVAEAKRHASGLLSDMAGAV